MTNSFETTNECFWIKINKLHWRSHVFGKKIRFVHAYLYLHRRCNTLILMRCTSSILDEKNTCIKFVCLAVPADRSHDAIYFLMFFSASHTSNWQQKDNKTCFDLGQDKIINTTCFFSNHLAMTETRWFPCMVSWEECNGKGKKTMKKGKSNKTSVIAPFFIFEVHYNVRK